MIRRALIIAIILVGLVAAASWGAVALSTPRVADIQSFEVVQGDSVRAVAERLERQRAIANARFFLWSVRDIDLASSLQPGAYDLRGARTLREIATTLASGGVASKEFTLRITEGQNLSDVKKALEDAGFAGEDLFRTTGIPAIDHRTLSSDQAPKPKDLSKDFPFLAQKPSYISMEGFLFPDTYRIYKDATTEEVVKKLLANFDRKFTTEMRAAAVARGNSIYEIVTMASIVEREVRTPEDRRMVADLFWRRIGAGMGLQADSTVNYATGKSLPSVTADDLQNISAYNTYKYRGLPPGPISNPGLDALRAAIEPTANPYWYFLTDVSGAVHYARTYEEHLRNKRKYID